MNEFELIKQYFSNNTSTRPDVIVGIGDDAAVVSFPADKKLIITTDTLVEGVHFPENTSAFDIGYKLLAVNLSDLAAMGAEPCWITLALTMPCLDENWLAEFSAGLFSLANTYDIQLIGGDTTRGPFTFTLGAYGTAPPQKILTRKGANAYDKIYITGTPGDAGIGLEIAKNQRKLSPRAESFFLNRLNRPAPRITTGKILRDFASSAIDISDGLLADLGHLLQESHVGATLITSDLPFSFHLKNSVTQEEAVRLALTAGDDYELCFTVSPENESSLLEALHSHPVPVQCIGVITKSSRIVLSDFHEKLSAEGYLHFE